LRCATSRAGSEARVRRSCRRRRRARSPPAGGRSWPLCSAWAPTRGWSSKPITPTPSEKRSYGCPFVASPTHLQDISILENPPAATRAVCTTQHGGWWVLWLVRGCSSRTKQTAHKHTAHDTQLTSFGQGLSPPGPRPASGSARRCSPLHLNVTQRALSVT
jgi:hypothetical protein